MSSSTTRKIRCSKPLQTAWEKYRNKYGDNGDVQKYFICGCWIPVGTEEVAFYENPGKFPVENGKKKPTIGVTIGPQYWQTLKDIATLRDGQDPALPFSKAQQLVRLGIQRFLFAERDRLGLDEDEIRATGFGAKNSEWRTAIPAGKKNSTARRWPPLDHAARHMKLTTWENRTAVGAALFPKEVPAGQRRVLDWVRRYANRRFDGMFENGTAGVQPHRVSLLAAGTIIVRAEAQGLPTAEMVKKCLDFVTAEALAGRDPFVESL